MGVSIYAGEAEGRLDKLFQDVYRGELKPIYNYMQELPDMANAAVPFLPDDNFARNKDWEAILDRPITRREEEGFRFKCFIQVDIGLENINPDALMGAKKRQNKIREYRNLLQAWKKQGIMTYVGYILGFPADTPDSIRRDIEILKNELPV